MDAEPFHHPIAPRDRAIRHDPHNHVHRLRHQRDKIPKCVVRGRRLGHLVMRFRFDGVNQVGKFHGVLNEKHGHVVAHQIEVSLLGVELYREAARVTHRIRRSSGPDDRGEAHEDRRLSCGILEEFGFRDGSHRLVDLKDPWAADATSMNDSFWNTLMVKVRDLLAQMKILEQRWSPLSRFEGILIVVDPKPLVGRHHLFVAALAVIGEPFHLGVILGLLVSFHRRPPFMISDSTVDPFPSRFATTDNSYRDPKKSLNW